MRRKLTEREIETLFLFLFHFLLLSILISFCISVQWFFWCNNWNVALIAFIWFLISFICFVGFIWNGGISDSLRKRNEKIDEEEKARQQALLLEAEERNRAELQIWVNE
jgi:hypothetical protein